MLPAVLAVLGAIELSALAIPRWQVGVLIEVVACALLVGRRRYPLVLPTLAGLVVLAMGWLGPGMDGPSLTVPMLLLAIFALARWNPDLRVGLVGVGLITAVSFVDILLVDVQDEGWPDLVFVVALAAPPFVLGRLTRTLTEQKLLLERQQDLVRQEAVRAERDRIARELHDVIAHSVSAMVVQTAAAQDAVSSDPERAHQILAEVADTGRSALAETGRLLHVLRDDADELGLRPAPGLAQLPALVDQFREQGLAVDAELPDPLPTVPAGVDVSAYRIVQEALTNALRYASDQAASLRVTSAGGDDVDRGQQPGRWADRRRRWPGAARRRRAGQGARRQPASRHVRRPVRARRHVAGAHPVTSVVVADDQDLVRSGLRLVLEARGCEVLAEAATGRQAVDAVRRDRPDVVLMDIRMPVLDGIAATREITAAGLATRVLVLTTYDVDAYVYEALRAGAAGFLLKATPPDRLVAGIETVAAGEALLAPSLVRRLIEQHVSGPPPVDGLPDELRVLTEREREVFLLIARGLANDEIATDLVVSEATVKTHVNRILAKLGLRTRVQLVVLAYESGALRPGG